MFGFLKDKLKAALKKFTKDVEEEVEEKVVEKKPKKEEKKKKAEEKPKEEKKEVKEKPKPKEVVEEKKPSVAQSSEAASAKAEPLEKKEAKKKEPVSKEVEKKPEKKPVEKVEEKPKVVEEVKETEAEKVEEEPKEEEKGFFGKLKDAFIGPKEEPVTEEKAEKPKVEKPKKKEAEKKEEKVIEKEAEPEEEVVEEVEEEPKKKGFFERLTEVVTKKTLSEEKFEELFFELELALLENNVAVEVIEKIKEDMKSSLLSEKVSRTKTELVVAESLRKSLEELFEIKGIDIFKEAKSKKPYVICFVGVNGSGKTTNLAKVGHMLKKKGLIPVIAACDTFRAAAIQQLEEHANKLGIKVIKHDYGADSAAVAYDAIEHAKARGLDVVLIDTAGRSHANTNLMDELEKVIRISSPDLKIFVGDSLTGNDAVEQAKTFNEKVGIDAIILTKADVDEKGGAAISISYVTQKPIIYIGTGQTYDDIEKFSKEKVLENLGV